MTPTSAAVHRRRSAIPLITAGAALAIVAGCTAADRPSFRDWSVRWDEAQLLVPTERELVDGGRTYCDRLLGGLRTELTDLTPTPSESIDPTLAEWRDHVRTLAFDCPADRARIRDALSTIHQFEAEIAAVEP